MNAVTRATFLVPMCVQNDKNESAKSDHSQCH